MPVRKAVIPAAGLGTRFLPASKAVPKPLITLVDRPVIQYAVEELVRAGITNICIVTSQGQDAIADHFSSAKKLESALQRAGKLELLEEVRHLHEMADIYSVRQNEPLGLGHAVWVAHEYVGPEPFVVLLPDEVFDPNINFLANMIATFDDSDRSVVAVHQVPHDDIRFYGSIEPNDPDASVMDVLSVVEKPDPATAPSDLALSGRYVLHPDVFDVLEKLDTGAGGEIQLADALGVLADRGQLQAINYKGRRWDVGMKGGYLEAVVALGAEHPELGASFTSFIERFRK
ncbi:MAG: UTP--glucose-1-phosphate uridylyltransferase [Actinomycetota bacterium]|nr:UTP--glucose-1-phosphate uridylyltransferase [Actinomycetota bacterium]